MKTYVQAIANLYDLIAIVSTGNNVFFYFAGQYRGYGSSDKYDKEVRHTRGTNGARLYSTCIRDAN